MGADLATKMEQHYKTFIVCDLLFQFDSSPILCSIDRTRFCRDRRFAMHHIVHVWKLTPRIAAGLNWVRIPIPYWAIETMSGEPFLPKVSWTYFLKALVYRSSALYLPDSSKLVQYSMGKKIRPTHIHGRPCPSWQSKRLGEFLWYRRGPASQMYCVVRIIQANVSNSVHIRAFLDMNLLFLPAD